MDSLPIRQKGVINWLLLYQKYHNTWAIRCSSTFTVTILKYLSVRFLQQLLLGNFKFRIYPQMFAKTTFILKDGWTPARVSRCHIAASQHAASIAARSPIHARVLYIVLNLNLEININMCVTHSWTVERWNAMPACKHARTQQLYVTGRETWWAPSLWRGVVARRLFHKERGVSPPYCTPRNCDQQGFCDSGESPQEPKPCLKPYCLWQDKAGRGWARCRQCYRHWKHWQEPVLLTPARETSWPAFPASAASGYGPTAAWPSWLNIVSSSVLQI